MKRRSLLKTLWASPALFAHRLMGASVKSVASPESMIARKITFPPGEIGDLMDFVHQQNQA